MSVGGLKAARVGKAMIKFAMLEVISHLGLLFCNVLKQPFDAEFDFDHLRSSSTSFAC